MLFNLL